MGLLAIQTVKKVEFPKSKTADGRHFNNRSHLRYRLTDFDEIWHSDAEPVFEPNRHPQ